MSKYTRPRYSRPTYQSSRLRLASFALLLLAPAIVVAGPWMAPGDFALRHDIQLLADAGVITAPVTTWPLSWGDILNDLREFRDEEKLVPGQRAALTRVRRIGMRETQVGRLLFDLDAHYDTEPGLLRGFEDRAREDTDITTQVSWLGERLAVNLSVNGVSQPDDDQDVRMDGSYIGFVIGNYMVSAGAMERWWGPGYDGSIILGNNQRPIPAIAIGRNDTSPFRSKWLRWIGFWDFSLIWGQLENDREVPNARFLGLRVNAKPLPSLEIGLSRTAQWCGNGDRPCDFDSLGRLILGQDNRGDDGISSSSEPGNQLAGVDFRWQPSWAPSHAALYGQFIGEDEAGGFPSRFLGQLGVEISGFIGQNAYRGFAEFSGTTCQFYEASSRPNCGYNNSIYQTGYRYKGRSIGHSADNDAEVITVGGSLVELDGDSWLAFVRFAALNQEGGPDVANTVSQTPADFVAVEVSHSRTLDAVVLEIGAGFSRFEDELSGGSRDDARFFLNVRMPF